MAEYQSSLDKFKELGVEVVAGSTDPLEDARKAVDELGITYPLAYGMDAEAIAKLIGAYFEVYKEAQPLEGSQEQKAGITGNRQEVQKKFLQPTGFLVNPEGELVVACYSSNHIGRLHAKEVGSLVKYLKGEK